MTHLLVIDPGKSTGITLGYYDDTTPYERIAYWQIERGLAGFKDWWYARYANDAFNYIKPDTKSEFWIPMSDIILVTEKFTPRQHSGFNLTLDSVEPLRIEGVLEYLGVMPPYDKTEKRWQQPQLQYFCGGKSKIEKRRKSKDWLKEHGLYLTGKYVGCKDAEDVISSQLHAFAYLRGIKHRPTLLHYFRSSP